MALACADFDGASFEREGEGAVDAIVVSSKASWRCGWGTFAPGGLLGDIITLIRQRQPCMILKREWYLCFLSSGVRLGRRML
jgi:hypothetical protein